MEVWYCDDNLARCEDVSKRLSKYNVKAVRVREAEKLMERERPVVIFTHTTARELLKKANMAGIPAVALVDDDSNVEDLRSAGSLASEVVDMDSLEKCVGKILPSGKEYDITKPKIPVVARYNAQNPTNYINPPQQFLSNPSQVPLTLTKNEIIVVASGKGGVGKTTITTCLGLVLQKRGIEVTVVDFDFKCPCVETLLQINHTKGLKGFITSPENIGGSLLDSFMATHSTGLKVLLPDSNLKLNGHDVEKILRNLIRLKEVIVIDVGMDTGEHVSACVNFATKVFLVTTLTAPSIQMCKKWIQKISPRDMTKLYMLINKSNKTAAFPVTAAHRVMGINLAGILPDEMKVAKGEGNGNPLPERGGFVKEINNLADLVWPWKHGSVPSRGLLDGLREMFKRR